MTSPDIEAALRQEREAIARMLHVEARKHEQCAADLLAEYDLVDVKDEVWMDEYAAETLNRYAALILARTPTVAVEEAPEIAF